MKKRGKNLKEAKVIEEPSDVLQDPRSSLKHLLYIVVDHEVQVALTVSSFLEMGSVVKQ